MRHPRPPPLHPSSPPRVYGPASSASELELLLLLVDWFESELLLDADFGSVAVVDAGGASSL